MAEQKAMEFKTIKTDAGDWMHAPGSDYVFAFIPYNLSDKQKKLLTTAFQNSLNMSETIKNAVKNTSGQQVVDGLYLEDSAAMTKAMNSIDGMGLTKTFGGEQSGDGTAVEINLDFFTAVLAGYGGDVEPMMTYLTDSMQKIQVQVSKQQSIQTFGTVMGIVSLMPILDVPVYTFQYVYSNSETASWMVKQNCSSTEKHSYDYKYQTNVYNYNPPTEEKHVLIVDNAKYKK